jgi:putative DNA primase/helicase
VKDNNKNHVVAVGGAEAPTFSDEFLALRFAERYEGTLRYVAEIGRWYCWDGRVWVCDRKLLGFNHARKICRAAAKECNESPHRSRMLASSSTVAAVERLARSDQRLAAVIEQWDANSWVLNTPDGVIDLKTQKLRPHRPHDHMTKITAVGPDKSCPTPLWRKFLNQVTDENAEVQQFLQRIFGYALTGDIREQAFFFICGPGLNGKTVLVETVLGLMNDYGRASPIETFTASSVDRHPTELARLHGARLVTASETEENRHWAESRIKQLTGGDRVSARFMRQNFFEYQPQFKLVIYGNHPPRLHSVGIAMRRRIHVIEFNVVIPERERDKLLKEKLKREWPGILAWMVDGCAEWQRHGLDVPTSVTSSTDHYLDEQDMVAAWIEETCVRDPNSWSPRSELFESWSWWAQRAKENCGTRPDFFQNLESRGFTIATRNGIRGFKGLRVQAGRI